MLVGILLRPTVSGEVSGRPLFSHAKLDSSIGTGKQATGMYVGGGMPLRRNLSKIYGSELEDAGQRKFVVLRH